MRVARILSVLALLGLSGCSLAPRLELPVVSAASNYKGAADWGLVSAADGLRRQFLGEAAAGSRGGGY